MPKVINLKATGYKLPEGALYVGSAMPQYALPKSRWRNPFRIGRNLDRAEALMLYSQYIVNQITAGRLDPTELRGHDLACWCAPLPCHADFLLELVNNQRGVGNTRIEWIR